METPEVGDRVRVKGTAGCEHEGAAHGMHPFVKGKLGIIIPPYSHVDPPEHHPWRVLFDEPIVIKLITQSSQYFAARELDLVLEEVKTPDGT